MGQIYLNGEAYGGGGGGGSVMHRVNYMNYDGTFLDREYVRDGDNALYSYKASRWTDEIGGAEIPNIQENIEEDLNLYYVYNGPLMKYQHVSNYTGIPYSYTYTVQKAGNYFVYVNAGATGSSSSITCSGTQKYYGTWSADSNRATKAGIYYCEVGDTIVMTLNGNTTYQNYIMFTALVIDMNTTFDSVTLEQSQTTTESGTCDKTVQTAGKKFAFANINYDRVQENHSVYVTCSNSVVDGDNSSVYDVKSSDSAYCLGLMDADDTLRAYAKQSSSYGTSIVLIFNLVTS